MNKKKNLLGRDCNRESREAFACVCTLLFSLVLRGLLRITFDRFAGCCGEREKMFSMKDTLERS